MCIKVNFSNMFNFILLELPTNLSSGTLKDHFTPDILSCSCKLAAHSEWTHSDTIKGSITEQSKL